MKILRFNDDRIGILKNEDRVVDVSKVIKYRSQKGPQRTIEEVIENFDSYRGEFEKIAARAWGMALSKVKLLAPIPRPSKCLAAFVNYLDRPDRSVDSLPMEYFYKTSDITGPGETIDLLDIPAVVVYQAEAELAFVMGKNTKNVSEEVAMDYIFGYVPFFDVSARGLFRRTQFVSKGQDTYAPCGPWITTKDEIPDPHNIVVKSWLNGEPRQNYNTKFMAHKIPEQIAWLSKFLLLRPGDTVATGTYHEGLKPVNGGEVLEIEIEKMGRVSFLIKSHGPRKDAEWVPGKNQPEKPATGSMVRV
ncbi:MAG: fumarylacetoacetate hydrolase family protein [Candidatus Binatia bacterium]|nr:fumarylacetoacetate hydrolase family protein [Candidatus Binatia bacterium]